MLLYTLDPWAFTRTEVIEEYISMVWTERFIEAGDVQLVLPATHANAKLVRPGTILNHEDSKELMILETREIKDGIITVSGPTFEKAAFNERVVANRKDDNLAYTAIIYDIVYDTVIDPTNLWDFYILPIEMADNPDPGVLASEYLVEIGENLYDAVLARVKRWGMNIYIHRVYSEADEEYKLRFYMRKGEDRTSANDPMDVVRFSPADDTLANVSEIYSRKDDVDYVIVYPPRTWLTKYGLDNEPERVYPGDDPISSALSDLDPFAMKMRHIETEDILSEGFVSSQPVRALYGYGSTAWSSLTTTQRQTVLRGEMARLGEYEYKKGKQKRLKFISGEVPSSLFVYGKDYHLGDIVETQGYYPDGHAFGGWQTAQVSEYIRSADENGVRSYPTLTEPQFSSTEAPVYGTPVPEQYTTTEGV